MHRATYRRWRLAKFVLLDVLFVLGTLTLGAGIGLAFGYIITTITK